MMSSVTVPPLFILSVCQEETHCLPKWPEWSTGISGLVHHTQSQYYCSINASTTVTRVRLKMRRSGEEATKLVLKQNDDQLIWATFPRHATSYQVYRYAYFSKQSVFSLHCIIRTIFTSSNAVQKFKSCCSCDFFLPNLQKSIKNQCIDGAMKQCSNFFVLIPYIMPFCRLIQPCCRSFFVLLHYQGPVPYRYI